MRPCIWKKGKQILKGCWCYNWASDSFTVTIYRRDRVTGDGQRTFKVYNDTPEWDGWELQHQEVSKCC